MEDWLKEMTVTDSWKGKKSETQVNMVQQGGGAGT